MGGRLERLRKRQEVEAPWPIGPEFRSGAEGMIENWRMKNEENFRKAERKRRESLGALIAALAVVRKEILHRNITERGPLEYLEPAKPPALPRLPKKQTEVGKEVKRDAF